MISAVKPDEPASNFQQRETPFILQPIPDRPNCATQFRRSTAPIRTRRRTLLNKLPRSVHGHATTAMRPSRFITFATVRIELIRSEGCLSNKTALAMVFKLV
jgi:hypothetical protein